MNGLDGNGVLPRTRMHLVCGSVLDRPSDESDEVPTGERGGIMDRLDRVEDNVSVVTIEPVAVEDPPCHRSDGLHRF